MFSSWSILHSRRSLQYIYAAIVRNGGWQCCFGAVYSPSFLAFLLQILENPKLWEVVVLKLPFQCIFLATTAPSQAHISSESGFCGQMLTHEVDSHLVSSCDLTIVNTRWGKKRIPSDKLSHCSPLCCVKYFVAFGKSGARGCLSSLSFYLIWLSWYVSVRDQAAHLLDIKAICRALVPPRDIALMHVPFIARRVKHPGSPMRLSRVPEKTAPSADDRRVFHAQPCTQRRAQMQIYTRAICNAC